MHSTMTVAPTAAELAEVKKVMFQSLENATAQGAPKLVQASWQQLLSAYLERNPTPADVVQRLWLDNGKNPGLIHDHFAFRTFGVPQLGISSLGSILTEYGYVQQNYLTFPSKKLLATWYAPPRQFYNTLPRIFVSELQVEKLSAASQEVIQKYVRSLPTQLTAQQVWTAVLTGTLPWDQPTVDDYELLLKESEYAAWTLVNGYALNHTTMSVHRLNGFTGDIREFAAALQAAGFRMNDEGGVIKVSPDGALLQCSTVADVGDFTFAGGVTRKVARSYLEFAERKPLPEFAHLPAASLTEEQRRDGFEAANADKIFHSTTLAGHPAAAAAARPA